MDGIKHLHSCHFHFKQTSCECGMLTIERVKLRLKKFESVFFLPSAAAVALTPYINDDKIDIKHRA